MRDAYHEELNGITDSLVEMTQLVDSAVGRATQALLDGDVALADGVIGGDDAIDALYVDIEQRAFDLLARQQPVATDLRILIASLRMVADLERSGDYALHVAEVARRRYPSSAIPSQLRATILEMGQIAQRILSRVGSVIAGRDVEMAAQIERDDDVMDDLHRRLFAVLLDDAWPDGVESAIDVILCGRYYERLADHAVSAARRVVYLVTGERPSIAASVGPEG